MEAAVTSNPPETQAQTALARVHVPPKRRGLRTLAAAGILSGACGLLLACAWPAPSLPHRPSLPMTHDLALLSTLGDESGIRITAVDHQKLDAAGPTLDPAMPHLACTAAWACGSGPASTWCTCKM